MRQLERRIRVGVVIALLAMTGCRSAPAASTAAPAAPSVPAASARSNIAFDELLAAPLPPAGLRAAYGTDSLQFGELRLPTGRGPFPVAVVIHGGCWLGRYDLHHAARQADALRAAGIATWSVEYRRVGNPGGGWPGTFDDIEHAIDHVRQLAPAHRLDTRRVVLVGHSAGGQLALWAASRARTRDGALQPRGVVALAAVSDLGLFASRSGCGSAVAPLMGGTAAEQPERYRSASPILLVPLGVRARLVHGESDAIVPIAQSQAFVARARAAGDDATLVAVPGGHFDLVAPASAAWPSVERAVRDLLGMN